MKSIMTLRGQNSRIEQTYPALLNTAYRLSYTETKDRLWELPMETPHNSRKPGTKTKHSAVKKGILQRMVTLEETYLLNPKRIIELCAHKPPL